MSTIMTLCHNINTVFKVKNIIQCNNNNYNIRKNFFNEAEMDYIFNLIY